MHNNQNTKCTEKKGRILKVSKDKDHVTIKADLLELTLDFSK